MYHVSISRSPSCDLDIKTYTRKESKEGKESFIAAREADNKGATEQPAFIDTEKLLIAAYCLH